MHFSKWDGLGQRVLTTYCQTALRRSWPSLHPHQQGGTIPFSHILANTWECQCCQFGHCYFSKVINASFLFVFISSTVWMSQLFSRIVTLTSLRVCVCACVRACVRVVSVFHGLPQVCGDLCPFIGKRRALKGVWKCWVHKQVSQLQGFAAWHVAGLNAQTPGPASPFSWDGCRPQGGTCKHLRDSVRLDVSVLRAELGDELQVVFSLTLTASFFGLVFPARSSSYACFLWAQSVSRQPFRRVHHHLPWWRWGKSLHWAAQVREEAGCLRTNIQPVCLLQRKLMLHSGAFWGSTGLSGLLLCFSHPHHKFQLLSSPLLIRPFSSIEIFVAATSSSPILPLSHSFVSFFFFPTTSLSF